MKSRTLNLVTAIAVVTVLTIPTGLAAQEEAAQSKTAQHHHYKVVVMAPFGGPTSSFDNAPGPPSGGVTRILNKQDQEIASGDTPIADPYIPPFVDGQVNYVFRWQNGVQTNLGVPECLAGNAASEAGHGNNFSDGTRIAPRLLTDFFCPV